MKRYTIDLNLPPEQRWTKCVQDHIRIMPALNLAYNKALDQHLGKYTKPVFNRISKHLQSRLIKQEWQQELKAIAELSGQSYDMFFNLNIGYDLENVFGCTSAIFFDSKLQQMVHFRTLDWDMPILKDLTIIADFVKDSRVIYSAVTWVGFIGVYTAVSESGHSISLNYRKPDYNKILRQSIIIKNLFTSKMPTCLMIREALENHDGEDLITFVKTREVIAPCYIIISTKQRAHCMVKGLDSKDRTRSNKTNRPLIQTNHDINHLYDNFDSWADKDDLLVSSFKRYNEVSDMLDRSRLTHVDLKEVFLRDPIKNKYTVYIAVLFPGIPRIDVL